jgi:hypothetical protein
MIISDLNYLEVVTEAENLEGGFFGDAQGNASGIWQSSGTSVTQQAGLVNVNASSNNVAVPIQLNLDNISL